MNGDNTPQHMNTKRINKRQRLLVIIIAVAVGLFIVIGAVTALLEGLSGDSNGSGGEVETVDPWLLDETKPEDFDIMEYEEYLALDRTIYRYDKYTGVTVSVSEDEYDLYGKEFELLCYVLRAINEGDVETYNGYMGDEDLEKGWFSQQQIYAIEISLYSSNELTDKEGMAYSEYVFEVRYKIHENNGTYRNTVDSDETRPQYFIINDSQGELLVMDILEKNYSK